MKKIILLISILFVGLTFSANLVSANTDKDIPAVKTISEVKNLMKKHKTNMFVREGKKYYIAHEEKYGYTNVENIADITKALSDINKTELNKNAKKVKIGKKVRYYTYAEIKADHFLKAKDYSQKEKDKFGKQVLVLVLLILATIVTSMIFSVVYYSAKS